MTPDWRSADLPVDVAADELRRLADEAGARYDARTHREPVPVDLPDPPTDAVARTRTPVVSVVLATRDRAPVLRATLATVQAQTLGDWELLVVDEGSTDDTPAVLTGLATYDDRVLRAPTRPAAVAAARGRFVAFLEPGSTWPAGLLAALVGALDAAPGRAVAHAATRVRDRGLVAEPRLDSLLVRTDALRAAGGFAEDLGGGLAHELALRLTARHPSLAVPVVGATVGARRDPARWVSAAVARTLLDWDEIARRPREAGRTSVVVPFHDDAAAVLAWFRDLAATDDPGLELVAVGAAPTREVDTLLQVLAALTPRASYAVVDEAVNDLVAQDLGLAHATGERVVLVRSAAVRAPLAALARLAAPLDDPGVAVVQPLLVDERGLVRAAGAVFGPGVLRPVPFLEGHATRDARDATGLVLPAAYGPVVAARAETLVRARGVDPSVGEGAGEVDLSLRAAALGLGRTVLAPAVEVTVPRGPLVPRRRYVDAAAILQERWGAPPPGSEAAWGAVGFEVVGHRHELLGVDEDSPGPRDRTLAVPRAVVVPARERLAVAEGLPRLRWVVDLASPAGPKGESWGDTHFARSLAAALERLGQHVAVDARQARHRPTRDHDDVLLALRGLDRVDPRPGQVSLLWVISHPDLVEADELAAYDAVFAASTTWARAAGVEPLLQCTDPALFHPSESGGGPEVLFVGNSRGVYRHAVRTAIAIGAPLTIHGAAWDDLVDPALVASRYVPNTELGRLYASAGVVLNDHHEDMRRDGFVSNRLFDAAATGARIISDEVPGLAELFGALVQPFHDEDDLRRLLAQRDTAFPPPEERAAIAARVVAEHSFDARARTLAEAAVRLRAQRQP